MPWRGDLRVTICELSLCHKKESSYTWSDFKFSEIMYLPCLLQFFKWHKLIIIPSFNLSASPYNTFHAPSPSATNWYTKTHQHPWRSSCWKHPPFTFHISWKPWILQPAFVNNIATRWKWKMWIPCSTNLLSHLMISGTCSSNRLKNASSSAGSTHVSRSSSSSHPLQCILQHLLYTISLPNVYAIEQIKLHLLEQMKF